MKRFLVLAAAGMLLSASAEAAVLSGRVSFLTRRGQHPVAAETLVWLDPLGMKPAARKPQTALQMTTRNKSFLPHVLAVPAGSTVSFPNEDPIAHNLFSLTPGNSFDLGLYRRGPGKPHTFTSPGIVNVYCNVHPNMSAVVHVMSTPYYGFTDAAGNYSLDAPPGKYRLSAWNEQGGTASSDVEVRSDGSVQGATALTIDGRSFRATEHMNKNGQPYRNPIDY